MSGDPLGAGVEEAVDRHVACPRLHEQERQTLAALGERQAVETGMYVIPLSADDSALMAVR